MARAGVPSWRLAGRQAVMDVTPIVRRCIGGVDAYAFDGVDHLQHLLDLCPTGDPQEDVAAGAHVGNGRARRTGRYGAQDVDAGHDGAEVVGRPADEGKDAAGREGEDAPAAIENLFRCRPAEADPVLDVLLKPQKLDVSEIAHVTGPMPCAHTSCSRPGLLAVHSGG